MMMPVSYRRRTRLSTVLHLLPPPPFPPSQHAAAYRMQGMCAPAWAQAPSYLT